MARRTTFCLPSADDKPHGGSVLPRRRTFRLPSAEDESQDDCILESRTVLRSTIDGLLKSFADASEEDRLVALQEAEEKRRAALVRPMIDTGLALNIMGDLLTKRLPTAPVSHEWRKTTNVFQARNRFRRASVAPSAMLRALNAPSEIPGPMEKNATEKNTNSTVAASEPAPIFSAAQAAAAEKIASLDWTVQPHPIISSARQSLPPLRLAPPPKPKLRAAASEGSLPTGWLGVPFTQPGDSGSSGSPGRGQPVATPVHRPRLLTSESEPFLRTSLSCLSGEEVGEADTAAKPASLRERSRKLAKARLKEKRDLSVAETRRAAEQAQLIKAAREEMRLQLATDRVPTPQFAARRDLPFALAEFTSRMDAAAGTAPAGAGGSGQANGPRGGVESSGEPRAVTASSMTVTGSKRAPRKTASTKNLPFLAGINEGDDGHSGSSAVPQAAETKLPLGQLTRAPKSQHTRRMTQ